jgi:hypothetical protein
MQCPICQTKLRSVAIFCDTCGNKMEKGSQSTIALPKIQSKPNSSTRSLILLFLGGAALLLVGVWTGVNFSATPMISAREISALPSEENKQALQSDIALPKKAASEPLGQAPPMSAPVAELAPMVAGVSGFAPVSNIKPQKSQLVDPFRKKKKQINTNKDEIIQPKTDINEITDDPFSASSRKKEAKPDPDPDSLLNPFKRL